MDALLFLCLGFMVGFLVACFLLVWFMLRNAPTGKEDENGFTRE
jgi:hypothetical protein